MSLKKVLYTSSEIGYDVGVDEMEDEMATAKFRNHLTQTTESECTETRYDRWYIKMGFAGFNTRANNVEGYATKEAAEAACLRHQYRGWSGCR
jgi:hypothetical protein